MNHPFTIIKGGQADPKPPPEPLTFARFDQQRAEIERIKARFYAQRDQAILKERAKYGIK